MDIERLGILLTIYDFNLRNAFLHYVVDVDYTEQFPFQNAKICKEYENKVLEMFAWFYSGGSDQIKLWNDRTGAFTKYMVFKAREASCGKKTFDAKVYEMFNTGNTEVDPVAESLKQLANVAGLTKI